MLSPTRHELGIKFLSVHIFNLSNIQSTINIQTRYSVIITYQRISKKTNRIRKCIQAKFSIMHLNIRSISNKFDSLKNFIDTLNIISFQIIGLTETWLNDNIMNCFILNNYEYFAPNRPEKRGGGLYVQNNWSINLGTT
jgi:hypothetical protein